MLHPRRTLTDSERLDWLRLIRTENVGPVTFHRLVEQYGSAKAAIAVLPELARRGGRVAPLKLFSKSEAEREVGAVRKLGARLLCACEPEYPAGLAAIDDAPPVLAVLGHIHLLAKRSVAMVGARNASMNGRKFAEMLARDIGKADYSVVSGLARGIDTAAHRGALDTGTVAVVAGGIDVVYPEENRGLYEQLAAQGAVVAECAFSTQPQARHFPRRNRIISGLSLGVVVVEAAPKSGSLITARMALEQGREVMAVPGSPLDPRCQGCNALIRDGATLVQSAEDVLTTLRDAHPPAAGEHQPDLFAAARPAVPDEAELERARPLVLEALGPSPVAIDELVRGCQLSPSVVVAVVLELELAGRAQRHPGNRIALSY
ncbi:DNA-protecting protein DprA [Azospirillum sp. RWY-5-1]|uniref:DNA-protecting protein DprA n=1 Tax=Azospirillum oleiclasticum TaxID=2735135 RepID=A0ABX2T2N9_9PROT|nr:DNA-processing protein DprA [Azospirillum oleiclasticum]NYZ11408.1 DNA-protecting protein DprA [Azospirillum oleiclasticum]NYZ18569.1 DNA-protecting protein DprA [Azospirillum oleiclasticum]